MRIFFSFLLIISGLISCKTESKHLSTLRYLKIIDSLMQITNISNLSPVIIDRHRKTVTADDTLSFAVGIMHNISIDTISLKLYKYDSITVKSLKILGYDRIFTPSKDSNEGWMTIFDIAGLKRGSYYYEGYMVFKGKKIAIRREILVN